MRKVFGFKAFYTARIGMQVLEGGNNDFAAYVSVLAENPCHSDYEPTEAGGKGEVMPNPAKMFYVDAKAQFGALVEALEAKGLRWRY